MVLTGLTDDQVLVRKRQYGDNVLAVKEETSWLPIFFSQFKSPLIYILISVVLISLFLKEYLDAGLMTVVVLTNVFMGFFQEHKTQKTLAALRRILKPYTTVIRNNQRKKIEVKDLVPGDLVFVSSGDKIPADGKFIEVTNILINEAVLTGEHEAVIKTTHEKNNQVFMGTTVIGGKGIIEVLKIGTQTEMGKISQDLTMIREKKTPLQQRLEKFALSLSYLIFFISFVIFIIGVFNQQNFWQMLRTAIILSVAAIPEGLPIAITIILALGMKRILKKQGLVKKLLTMETLGVTSVICTDKTGTLTEGKMRVVKTDFIDPVKAQLALILTNEQKTEMEISLWNYVKENSQFNLSKVQKSVQKVYEEPFDSEKKYALTVAKIDNQEMTFIVGAPEIILNRCRLMPLEKDQHLLKIEDWASKGLRLVGLIGKNINQQTNENNYVWLGLVGLEDPIRVGVKEAITIAQQAGIDVKIVTGDYRKTAEKIASTLGFNLKKENIIEGKELEIIKKEDLGKLIDNLILFTRITPHQKLKIVEVLQERGETVAMTGDGVNDALALKKADIGIAVSNASDVAKEAADLILLDNNFQTIITACKEGRLIINNIRKVVAYILSNSFAEIILIFTSILFRLPAPLTIAQILWIHLICDGPADVVLSFEKENQLLFQESPRELRKKEILDNSMKLLIFLISSTVGLSALALFAYYWNISGDFTLARTIAFATVASCSSIYIFAFKNLNKLIIQTENFFKNKYLIAAVIYGFLLILAAIYLPFLNRILGTTPLKSNHWLLIFGVGLLIIFWVELFKLINNQRRHLTRPSGISPIESGGSFKN